MKTDCMAVLRAMGEINRMRILRLLLTAERSVGDIARELRLSPYNVSKHLRVLREAGLVEMRRQGRNRLCALPAPLRRRLAANRNELRLQCCTLRFDRLPK